MEMRLWVLGVELRPLLPRTTCPGRDDMRCDVWCMVDTARTGGKAVGPAAPTGGSGKGAAPASKSTVKRAAAAAGAADGAASSAGKSAKTAAAEPAIVVGSLPALEDAIAAIAVLGVNLADMDSSKWQDKVRGVSLHCWCSVSMTTSGVNRGAGCDDRCAGSCHGGTGSSVCNAHGRGHDVSQSPHEVAHRLQPFHPLFVFCTGNQHRKAS